MPNAKRRHCYWIDPAQDPARHGGYVPSLVVEDEPGHTPMLGNGRSASPWVWGQTLDVARQVCDKTNADTFDLTPAEANAVVISSMRADLAKTKAALADLKPPVVEVVVHRGSQGPCDVAVIIDGEPVTVTRTEEVEPEDQPGAYDVPDWRAKADETIARHPDASTAFTTQVRQWYADGEAALLYGDEPGDENRP